MHANNRRARPAAALTLTLCVALGACIGDDESGEFYTDWDRAGGCLGGNREPWGKSLAGEPLGPCMFSGQFVWVSYDALWCATCRRQATDTATAAASGPAYTVFVSVITGGPEVFVEASDDEMRGWAQTYGLDPRFVVSEGGSSRSVPQHALIGPDGRTWYRYAGLLPANRILDLIEDFRLGRRQPPEFGP